jgi:hypothetical protein
MTYRIRTLAAVAATISASLLAAPSAHADRVPVNEGGDTQSCVTYAEFLTVQDAFMHRGLSRGQVRRMFDTDGHRTSTALMDQLAGSVNTAPGTEVVVPEHRMVRVYRGCPEPVSGVTADVYIEYNMTRDRMVAGYWD